MRPDPKLVAQLVSDIVAAVDPLRVVLFGSAGRGTMRDDSDLDVLVVMPAGAHRRRTAQLLYRNIWDVPAPADIVVVTEDDLESWKDDPARVIRHALVDGETIYERVA